ncbi:hypothetical protein RRG08_002864 [Elysia crispata]|uniref:Uncharacterized protein n=1 Tax=Elysia crispata TaxID=231223 RepID=A0AAE0XUH8_9GAST|nr:hypothetical protein RRG08_002864 [Elysia crispata]
MISPDDQYRKSIADISEPGKTSAYSIPPHIRCSLYPSTHPLLTVSLHTSAAHSIPPHIRCSLYPSIHPLLTLSLHTSAVYSIPPTHPRQIR